jgi:hypothetical protein
MKDKKIKFELPLPSISLKKFIEKILANDDFFSFALENPLGAFKECGVNLNAATLIPSDLANFFGALDGLKVILKEKKIEDLSFENVFGQPAQIRGAILDQEISRGFFREWDNHDAIKDKMMCYSTNQKFEALRERIGNSLKNMLQDSIVQARSALRIETRRDMVGRTWESQETSNHTSTEWDKQDMQSNTRSERGVDKNFERDGIAFGLDRMHGPLINPVDLAAISSRIEVFTNIVRTGLKEY